MSKARDLAGIFNLNPTSGTTAQRPATADVGEIYYNGTTGKTQIYTPTGWQDMASGIPYGNTAGRPAAVTGQPYFNGETQRLEMYTAGGSWENIVQEVPGVSSISGVYSEQSNSGVITIYGTNFVNGAYVTAIGTNGVQINATSTTFNSLVQLTATFTGLSNANEPYDIKVTNPSNLFGLIPDALYVNASPVWVTASGSLGTFNEQLSITLSALSATDSDSTTITYALASGSSLPSGVNLNSATGVISGTLPDIATNTTYTFTVNASDGLNVIPRTFSISSVAYLPLTSIEYLVLAGGGGGGNYGAGGGGGGMRESSSYAVTQGTAYSLIVGNGGNSAYTRVGNGPGYGNRGADSMFATITSTGGGGGAGPSNVGTEINGGSGGGCGYESLAEGRVAGVSSPVTSPVQGYAGGIPSGQSTPYPSGGGGGAGGAAETGFASGRTTAGYGGPGRSSSITGIATYYGGGGGGGIAGGSGYTPSSGNVPGAGGVGGGGVGSGGNPTGNAPAGNGVDNLGGGGGGGGYSGNSGVNYIQSGTGGKGVVVIAYPITSLPITTISAGLTYTVDTTTRAGYRVYKFTSGSGTVTL